MLSFVQMEILYVSKHPLALFPTQEPSCWWYHTRSCSISLSLQTNRILVNNNLGMWFCKRRELFWMLAAGRDIYFKSNLNHFREPPRNSRVSKCLALLPVKPGSGCNQVQGIHCRCWLQTLGLGTSSSRCSVGGRLCAAPDKANAFIRSAQNWRLNRTCIAKKVSNTLPSIRGNGFNIQAPWETSSCSLCWISGLLAAINIKITHL